MWHREHSTYSYEILWRASQSALETEMFGIHARDDYLAIYALLSGFLAFEGFVNFVGEEIAPSIWSEERTYFARAPYKGIAGKVQYLFSLFAGQELRAGENPYQAFFKLKQIRDALAHNKVFRYKEISHDKTSTFKTRWDEFDETSKIRPALEQLKIFAEIIRVEAVKLLVEEYPLSHLHYPAFEGPIAEAEGTSDTL